MLLEVAEISETGKVSLKILVIMRLFCISGTALSTKRVIVLLVVEKFESSAWVITIVVVPTPVIDTTLEPTSTAILGSKTWYEKLPVLLDVAVSGNTGSPYIFVRTFELVIEGTALLINRVAVAVAAA